MWDEIVQSIEFAIAWLEKSFFCFYGSRVCGCVTKGVEKVWARTIKIFDSRHFCVHSAPSVTDRTRTLHVSFMRQRGCSASREHRCCGTGCDSLPQTDHPSALPIVIRSVTRELIFHHGCIASNCTTSLRSLSLFLSPPRFSGASSAVTSNVLYLSALLASFCWMFSRVRSTS